VGTLRGRREGRRTAIAGNRRTIIPSRTARMFRFAATALNSTAAAKSIFVIGATSALMKIVGYLSGLFSPSVTVEPPSVERALDC
jgi:hypothetical protein